MNVYSYFSAFRKMTLHISLYIFIIYIIEIKKKQNLEGMFFPQCAGDINPKFLANEVSTVKQSISPRKERTITVIIC